MPKSPYPSHTPGRQRERRKKERTDKKALGLARYDSWIPDTQAARSVIKKLADKLVKDFLKTRQQSTKQKENSHGECLKNI